METNPRLYLGLVALAIAAAVGLGLLLRAPSDTPPPPPSELPDRPPDLSADPPSARPIPARPEPAPPGALVVSPSGLSWWDIDASPLTPVATSGDRVVYDWTGWTADGRRYGSSRTRPRPDVVHLGERDTLVAIEEGLTGMHVGGRRQLHIPAALGFGEPTPPGEAPSSVGGAASGAPPGDPSPQTPLGDLIVELELIALRIAPDQPPSPGPDAVVTTPSGLRYADLSVGSGGEAGSGSRVVVDYAGWLEDGERFDSSWERNDAVRFTLGDHIVIPGWEEGVAGMRVGGRRWLRVPSDLAYGEKGRPPFVPPNSTLVFEVNLVDIE